MEQPHHAWISRKKVRQVAELEFSLYSHHTQAKAKNEYLGFMQHSLILQLIRQDPACYRFAVTMRADHEWKLFAGIGAAQAVKGTKIIKTDFGQKENIVQAVRVFNVEVPMMKFIHLHKGRTRFAVPAALSASRPIELPCRVIHSEFQMIDDIDIFEIDKCFWEETAKKISFHGIFWSISRHHCSVHCPPIWVVSSVKRTNWAQLMGRIPKYLKKNWL